MKPCARHRESVALLACAVLDAEDAAPVRQHLLQCPACSRYFQEMAEVCDTHAMAARHLPEARISPRLQARISAATGQQACSWGNDLVAALRGWRVQAGVAVVILLLAAGLTWILRTPPAPAQVAIRPTPDAPAAMETGRAGSRLGAYRLALSRSPEDLDRLLVSEAARSGFSPASSFRAGLAGRDVDF